MQLYIDNDVINHPITRSIRSKFKGPVKLVDDRLLFLKKINQKANNVGLGKNLLYLTKNKGNFLKKCPGTSSYRCCNYFILHIGSFCFMDCSYCILQSYFHPPIVQLFVNHEELDVELNKLFVNKNIVRVGTGEFADSLIWEKFTKISKILIEKFSRQDRTILELKTKTVNIEKFKEITHNKKTILSWSLNTSKIIRKEERYTATLNARLAAAKKCASWGYPVAFHLDPMIIYEGCETDYKKVVKSLFQSVPANSIIWISMGTLRFPPILKPIIKKRFPSSKIIYGEFVRGIDGKLRYFKPLRIKLYQEISKYIKKISPDVLIYLCMEDDETWKKVFNLNFSNNEQLGKMLDGETVKKCHLNLTPSA